jgi:uncharacterized protein
MPGREERTWITMADGVRLSATLYLPEVLPAPVVLEALPYRKDDLTVSYSPEYRRLRDEGGYAVARVDLRGTGSSEGVALDEYPPEEQRDLCEVIAWLADREWSSGAVGMYGTSYSGFNSIQLAMERPPALKAIVAIYATDDRYTDDVHYEGGVLKALDFIDYVLYMTPMNALPPVPGVFGDGWRAEWDERVAQSEPWLIRWLEEQSDGPYWRHGSLRPRYEAIECATMIVAGWADGYRNSTFRMFERLRSPKRMLIGPWPHASTQSGLPGPHIDLVPEMIRWWDRWLKDEPNGLDDEPPITFFARRSTRPEPDLAEMRGEWRSAAGWPLAGGRTENLSLEEARRTGSGAADELVVRADTGWTAHLTCAGLLPWGQPMDQRPDEAFSLTYDWSRAGELEILGYPRIEVTVAADRPVAYLVAKLCDVFPDGTSALVARGVLNLTHRESHAEPVALTPGERYTVALDLSATSWIFEAGHRLRLDIAGTDWPNVWTPPEPVTLSVVPDKSRLLLPVVAAHDRLPPPDLPPPRAGKPSGSGAQGEEPRVEWRIEHDVLARETRYVVDHGSSYEAEERGRASESYFGRVAVSTSDPGRARAEGRVRFTLSWPEATVATEARGTLTSDSDHYHLDLELDVFEGEELRARRTWKRSFPRRLQ